MPTPELPASYGSVKQQLIDEIRKHGRAVTGSYVGRQALLLNTTGARSGEPRLSPLAYSVDNGRYIVTASRGGSPTHPGWYFNLLEDPVATIEVGLQQFQARASTAEGPEREPLAPARRPAPGHRRVPEQDHASHSGRRFRATPVALYRRPAAVALSIVTYAPTRDARFWAMLAETQPAARARHSSRRWPMTARIKNRIILESERVGQRDREGDILEVIEASYGTRYRVRWDDGHESTIRPAAGSARIVRAEPPSKR